MSRHWWWHDDDDVSTIFSQLRHVAHTLFFISTSVSPFCSATAPNTWRWAPLPIFLWLFPSSRVAGMTDDLSSPHRPVRLLARSQSSTFQISLTRVFPSCFRSSSLPFPWYILSQYFQHPFHPLLILHNLHGVPVRVLTSLEPAFRPNYTQTNQAIFRLHVRASTRRVLVDNRPFQMALRRILVLTVSSARF